jgi:hypothetical protein
MQWGIGWLYIGEGSATVGGPNGHRSNGSEIEGRPDPRLKAGVPDGARRGGQTGCPTGLDGVPRRGARRGQTGWPDGVARRGARRGWTGCPTGPDGVARRGARRVARRGGHTGCPMGPDGARRVPRHWPRQFLNATSSATSFLNAMLPV